MNGKKESPKVNAVVYFVIKFYFIIGNLADKILCKTLVSYINGYVVLGCRMSRDCLLSDKRELIGGKLIILMPPVPS